MSQNTPLITDIIRRPQKYACDILTSGAIWFITGNSVFAYTSGFFAGMQTEQYFAASIQAFIGLYVLSGQIKATYLGEHYAVPFRRLGLANFATAFLMAAVVTLTIPSQITISILLPALTLCLWGVGHMHVAKMKDQEDLLRHEKKPHDIENHSVQNHYNKANLFYGLADMTAILSTAINITTPWVIAGTVVAGTCFALGLGKTLLKKSQTGISPFRLYALGYLTQALFSMVSFLAFSYNACWAWAYQCLTIPTKAESADKYTARALPEK
jgi:hypothetical protein